MTTDTGNPYFAEVAGGVTVGQNRWDYSRDHIDALLRREALTKRYAWAIPNDDAIQTICDHAPILEVGAGSGYWAHLIHENGGDILATDLNAPIEPSWHPVWKADARTVVTDYPEQTLLMVWPTYDDSWPVEALGAYGSAGGQTFIYVGEGRGGCTATDRFHEMLHNQWTLVETVQIPSFVAVRDRLEVWTRD